ncbi:MAG: hypothetical protein HY557_08515 [Euryarchaeota archaeon]|nr:hypothetical protein [Euryarchaeota archaeon]
MVVSLPPSPSSSPWLHISSALGRVAMWFLLAANFALLLAPLFFLANPAETLQPEQAPGGPMLALFSDPSRMLGIADLLAIIGTILFVAALFLILIGMLRGDRRTSLGTFTLGLLVLVCLAAWVPVMLYAQGRATGTLGTVDAVAATGGWSVASAILLAATVLYLLFTRQIDQWAKPIRLSTLRWPVYAAVNLLGTAAIAGFFSGAASGSGNVDAFSLGLALKVTLIPVIGILAYRDMKDRFVLWEQLPLLHVSEPTQPPAHAVPLPPPPED